MSGALPIRIPNEKISEFCRVNHIRQLSLFGSVLRDDFTPESDVDVLVEFEPGNRLGFFGFARLERELTELFGRTVDLNTPHSLSKYFRDEVFREARTIHVAA